MNILFVCSRNKWRSPTAEAIYKNDREHNVLSAGTEPSARVKVTAKLINWAHIIFVMEKRHSQRMSENFPREMLNKKVYVLDISDDYHFMDEELIDSIKTSVSFYFPGLKG